MPFKTVPDIVDNLVKEKLLKKYPGGVSIKYRDGGQTIVTQTEYHPDHAPTVEEVLNKKTKEPTTVYSTTSVRDRQGRRWINTGVIDD